MIGDRSRAGARGNAATVTRVLKMEARVNVRSRAIAIDEMKTAAPEIGANAVVAVDIDYETVGGNVSMLMVTVSGTAVVLQ